MRAYGKRDIRSHNASFKIILKKLIEQTLCLFLIIPLLICSISLLNWSNFVLFINLTLRAFCFFLKRPYQFIQDFWEFMNILIIYKI